jgi:hypothetical protein
MKTAALLGSNFLKNARIASCLPALRFPCIKQLVDRHVTPPGKHFCGKNNLTQVCLADQLLSC